MAFLSDCPLAFPISLAVDWRSNEGPEPGMKHFTAARFCIWLRQLHFTRPPPLCLAYNWASSIESLGFYWDFEVSAKGFKTSPTQNEKCPREKSI